MPAARSDSDANDKVGGMGCRRGCGKAFRHLQEAGEGKVLGQLHSSGVMALLDGDMAWFRGSHSHGLVSNPRVALPQTHVRWQRWGGRHGAWEVTEAAHRRCRRWQRRSVRLREVAYAGNEAAAERAKRGGAMGRGLEWQVEAQWPERGRGFNW